MPVSPNIGQTYAEEVAALYRDAELRILARITTLLRQGIDTPTWEADALVRAQRLRDQAVRELNRTNTAAARAIQDAVTDAYDRGGAAALRDIGSLATDLATAPVPARVAATQAIVRDVTTGLDDLQPAILRRVDDIYRQTVARATAQTLAGGIGRKAAAQAALSDLAGRGIDRIPLSRGSMGMSDYLSMAVRTATSRAAIEGTTATMQANDIGLVVIHPGPRACDICDTWARAVLTIDPGGVEGEMTVDAVDGSGQVTVDVAGSLDDARDDGWGHPNCRCAVSPYLPGVTDPSIIDRPPWDAEGYAAQQQQRQIERQIRNWKTREVTSLDDDAAAAAHDKVLEWQATQRDHLAQHDYLKRQSDREQIGRII